ncbi:hypothetical protein IQ07DRAFT_403784 [Pyrenochaeta sp. DS3sAY3a]|nr:hypothetical protein IQ07DRAFT_403784 [Pyrenochaeta sp. DS3sAY3a]
MTTLNRNVFSLSDDHNAQYTTTSTNPLPSPTESSQENAPPQFTSKTISRMDRDSAIALAIILAMTLAAIVYYLHSCIKSNKQLDLERQKSQDRRWSSVSAGCETKAWPQHGSEHSYRDVKFRNDSIFDTKTRRHKSSTSNGYNQTNYSDRRNSWLRPNSSLSPTSKRDEHLWGPRDTSASTIVPHSLEECPFHGHLGAPSLTHRGLEEIEHDPLFFPQRRRSSNSISQAQYDRRWWTEVARRGSTSAASRRLSVLEPILEPGVSYHSFPARGNSTNRRVSRRVYDWTRPTVTPPLPSDKSNQSDRRHDRDERRKSRVEEGKADQSTK